MATAAPTAATAAATSAAAAASAIPLAQRPPGGTAAACGGCAGLLDLPDDCLRLVAAALWSDAGGTAATVAAAGRTCRRLRRAVNDTRPALTLPWCVDCEAAAAAAAAAKAAAAAGRLWGRWRGGGTAGGGDGGGAAAHVSLAAALPAAVELLGRLGGLVRVALVDAAHPPEAPPAGPAASVRPPCTARPADRAAVWRAVGATLRAVTPRLATLSTTGMAAAAVAPAAADAADCGPSRLTTLTVSATLGDAAANDDTPLPVEAPLVAALRATAPALRSLTLTASGGWSDGALGRLLTAAGGLASVTSLTVGLGGAPLTAADAAAIAMACPAVADVSLRDGLTVAAGDTLRLSRGAWQALATVAAVVDWAGEAGTQAGVGGLAELLADRTLRQLSIDGGRGGGGGVWGTGAGALRPRPLVGFADALLGCRRLPASLTVRGVALDGGDWAAVADTHRAVVDLVHLSLPRRDCAAGLLPHLAALGALSTLSLGLNVGAVPPAILRPGGWTLPPRLTALAVHLYDGAWRWAADDGRWRSVIWAVAAAVAASVAGATTLTRLAVAADGDHVADGPFTPLGRCAALRRLAVHLRDDGGGGAAKLQLNLPRLLPRVAVSVTAEEEEEEMEL